MEPVAPRSRRAVRPARVAVGLLVLPLILGFFGAAWWRFDLFANFRPQIGALLLLVACVWVWFDRDGAAMLGFAGLIGVSSLAPLLVGSSPEPVGPTIEVVSFNVGVSNPQRDEVAAFLLAEEPDVVFLFESSFEWEAAMRRAELPLALVREVPRDRVAGVTVLVAPELEPVLLALDVRGEAAAVAVNVGGANVEVIGVHPPSPTTGDRADRRDSMLAAVGEWVSGRQGPVVVVGDLNATRWSAPLRRLQWVGGLVDSMAGAGFQPSWPDGWGPLSIPIDHVLHSAGLAAADRRTGPAFGSSHRPVLVSVGAAG